MKKILTKIKHFSQRDNVNPNSTCFPTSVAMALTYHSANTFDDNFDNEVIIGILKKESEYKSWLSKTIGKWTETFKPYQVFAFWEKYIPENVKGLEARYLTKNVELYKTILDKRPLVVGTTLTHSGHLVVLVGYDTKKDGFWVLDPYGKAPYKTEKEIKNTEPYWVDGYGWLTDHALDIYEVNHD